MDRKRSRQTSTSGEEKRQKFEVPETDASLEHRLRNDHPEVVLSALNSCKARLVSKSKVESFVESETEEFSAVLDGFKRAALSEVGRSSPWSTVLKKAASIIATCCYFSFSACMELAKPRRNIFQTLGRLLEMSEERVSLSTKASLLRLTKNLCQHQEVATSMAYYTLDSIVQFLTNEDRNVGINALGTIHALVNLSRRCAARVVSANGCKYIGDLLAREEKLSSQESWSPRVFGILRRLAPTSATTARNIGRQLAMSKGGEALLSMFLKEDCDEEFRDMVVKICTHSSYIRELFCEHSILEKIVAMERPPTCMISILCAYTKEAWSRERLLNVGALDVMLNRFCESSLNSERLMIISSLVQFFHYVGGLVHIFRNTVLLKTIVAEISRYLGEFDYNCKHRYNPNDLLLGTKTTMEQRVKSRLQSYSTATKERMSSTLFGRLGAKPSDPGTSFGGNSSPAFSWSRSVSPPSSSLGSGCGPLSPPSAGSMSPPSVISPSSSVEDFFSLRFLDESAEEGADSEKMETEDTRKGSVESTNEERMTMQKIVSTELQLFSFPTSDNNILGILFQDEILDVLLRSCSEESLCEANPVKILLRMIEYRTMMDKLLSMQLHSRIFHMLMTKKWNMESNEGAISNHCTTCSTLGHLLLKELAFHVDSAFGLPILVDALKSSSMEEKLKASVATLYLVRSPVGNLRIYSKFDPVNMLIRTLRDVLSGESCKERLSKPAYDGGPSLLYQILCSFSAVTDYEAMCPEYRFENEAYNFIMIGASCRVHDEFMMDDGEYVIFKKENGEELERISKEALISNSDYFKGMFASEFREKTSGCDTFIFSEELEDCTEEEFRQFLHYLCGCRSETCFRLNGAHPVVVMIRLSDRYLCTSMTDMLRAENGPAIYYMLKGDLEEFLSPLLFTGIGECERFEDAFFFQLLRFSTDDEVKSTLCPLMSNKTATEVFVEKLTKFLQRHIIQSINFQPKIF